MDHLKSKVSTANKQLVELEKRLKESTASRGIVLDETSNSDFLKIMEEMMPAYTRNLQRELFKEFFGNSNFKLLE